MTLRGTVKTRNDARRGYLGRPFGGLAANSSDHPIPDFIKVEDSLIRKIVHLGFIILNLVEYSLALSSRFAYSRTGRQESL